MATQLSPREKLEIFIIGAKLMGVLGAHLTKTKLEYEHAFLHLLPDGEIVLVRAFEKDAKMFLTTINRAIAYIEDLQEAKINYDIFEDLILQEQEDCGVLVTDEMFSECSSEIKGRFNPFPTLYGADFIYHIDLTPTKN